MTSDQRRFFRDEFRSARASALRDAENFDELLILLERLGLFLLKAQGSLKMYEPHVADLARESPLATLPPTARPYHTPIDVPYDLVRQGRNDAAHQGAIARNLTDHVVQLSIILGDALSTPLICASDFMVAHPVCAGLWEPVSFVRQKMLVNAFSYLPVNEQDWRLLSDRELARFLRTTSREHDRGKRLAMTLEDALRAGLKLDPADRCAPQDEIATVVGRLADRPMLVTSPEGRLIGILTAFDLL
jgi:CBS domain-containing protein